jgi:hypothetical protein
MSQTFILTTLYTAFSLTLAHAADCEPGWECHEALGTFKATGTDMSGRPFDCGDKCNADRLVAVQAENHRQQMLACDKLPTTYGVFMCRLDNN